MTPAEAKLLNRQFELNVKRWADATKGDMDKITRAVVLDLGAAIMLRTPRDTGHLAANWQYGTDVVPASVLPGTDASLAASLAGAEIKAGHIHYIVNHLPYAPVVEYGLYPNPPANPTGKTAGGYSVKAPQGMVRVTVVEYRHYMAEAVRQVRR